MRRWALGVAATAVVVVTACSGEDAPKPSGAPMSAAPAPTASVPGTSAPRLERVLFEPDEPIPGGRVRAVVRAPDSRGSALRLHYAWTLRGEAVAGDTPEITLASAHKGDEVGVTVTASDGTRESAPVHSTTTVGNRPPRLVAVALEPAEGLRVGDALRAVPEADDPDGDTLEYQVEWRVNGTPASGHELTLQTGDLHRGDRISASVRASDGQVETDPVASREVALENSAPRIVSRPETKFENGVFRYRVEARDPDGDRNLRFSLLSAPEGMTIDRLGGEIHWQPTPDQTGKHAVEVAVEDSQGGKSAQRFELSVGAERRASAWNVQPPAAPAGEGSQD